MSKAKLIYLIIALIFVVSLSPSQPATYQFLLIDPSARASALGGSFIGMRNDPNGMFYNPALIGTFQSTQISFTYLNHLMDVNAGTLSLGHYLKGIGNIGMGILYVDYGNFQRTDEVMNPIGSFSANDFALTIGTAFHYDKDVIFGINAKYIHSSIAEYSSYALSLDLGIIYEIPSENLVIGASLLNIGQQFKSFSGILEPLPREIKLGITKKPEHLPAYLNIVFHKVNDGGTKIFKHFQNFTFGAEFLMSNNFQLRVGYNNRLRRDMKMGATSGLAGFSIGVGFIYKNYQIDYAYNSIGKNLDGLQRLSLGIIL